MGLHHTIRLPIYGRSLAYHSPSADALVGCTGNEVFRFNLEEGRYMTPLRVAQGWGDGNEDDVEGVNVVDVNPRHGLWSFGFHRHRWCRETRLELYQHSVESGSFSINIKAEDLRLIWAYHHVYLQNHTY